MTQQPVGDAVPAFLFRGDAEALQAWLAALPGLSGPAAAVRERLDAAIANNTNPIRLLLTPGEAAAVADALRAGAPPAEREGAAGRTVLRALAEIVAPDAGRPWRHKPPPTHW